MSEPSQRFSAMISSTALDLPEHRALVHKACLEAGVFPIGMEQLPARDASGITASLEMVDKADLYLGIYAFRYGWVPDGEAISITEMEFDRAVARQAEGKLHEILAFTADESHPFTKKDIEADAAAQEKLGQLKTRAASGRVRAEFKSAEDLRRLVLHALHEFQKRHAARLASQPAGHSPTTSIPHNLPSLQPFFGREEELAKIADALDPESRNWGALIDGPGGMGKTSLAVRAAYGASPDVFHKIIFVSLKTRELDDDGLRDLSGFILSGLAELFGELARELGRPEILKSAEDQRPRLLLDALRGTQTLLLLDNLESLLKRERDTVFTFVNKLPLGCKAILTSRGRIGSGAQELILEKLSEAAALATLAELATHNPLLAQTSEAERLVLYRETGGKPLLLRWTAGQLGRGHCLTFTDALHFLRSCPAGNDPLEFIFGDLVEDFTEAETRVLCALTYFTQPAKVEHIQALTEPLTEMQYLFWIYSFRPVSDGVPDHKRREITECALSENQVETALRSLTVRSLVVPRNEFQVFALVPMVADFIRKRKPQVVADTGSRLEKRAYALICENGFRQERFSVLDSTWPSVAPALPLFIAGPHPHLQALYLVLHKFLVFTGRTDEQLSLSQHGEAKAEVAGDGLKAGRLACAAGVIHSLRGEAAKALACSERATAHWRNAGPCDKERSLAIQLRGSALQLKRDHPAAIAAFREALALRGREGSEDVDAARLFNELAVAERCAGDLPAAEQHLHEAIRIAQVLGAHSMVATFTGNRVDVALDREDWLAAAALAHEALHLSEAVDQQELIASNCQRLAKALAQQDRAAEAQPYARRAIAIYTHLGSPELDRAVATLRECEG